MESITEMGDGRTRCEDSHSEFPETSEDNKDACKEGSVRFRSRSSIEQVMRISRVSNYDMEEVISYWGNSDEQIQRKSELKKDVQDMYFNRRTSDCDFTNLGIEDKAGQGKRNKKVNRLFSREAVLDEQEQQRDEGVVDDGFLANVYTRTTVAARREAENKAKRLHNQLTNEEKIK